jgi:hypothetical protein
VWIDLCGHVDLTRFLGVGSLQSGVGLECGHGRGDPFHTGQAGMPEQVQSTTRTSRRKPDQGTENVEPDIEATLRAPARQTIPPSRCSQALADLLGAVHSGSH